MTINRNACIDLLRILLMLFIITGHCVAHTSIRGALSFLSDKWLFTWGVQALTVCAVDCFILITGYFMANKIFKSGHIAKLWLKTWVYSILITGIFFALKLTPFSVKMTVEAFFPVFGKVWWFITCYIMLYILSPFINAGLNTLKDKQLNALMLLTVIVFYVLPLFAIIFPPFDNTEGMGITGFITLYITGFYLAKKQFNLSLKKCFFYLLINNLVIFLSKILLTFITQKYNIQAGTALLYHYNTVFELLNAILLFLIFKQINIKKAGGLVFFLSSGVFAVYLIHEHPLIRNLLWQTGLKEILAEESFFRYIWLILAMPFVILITCILIDKILDFILFKPVFKSKLWDFTAKKLGKADLYFNGITDNKLIKDDKLSDIR